jgi:SET domain-containing protein
MKTQLVQNKLMVKKSLIHGYGVFCEENIYPGDVIEECHVLIDPILEDALGNYTFRCGDSPAIIPLGFGCIYNHSDDNNAYFYLDKEQHLMIYKATKFISKGEEIFISYGPNWFGSRNAKAKRIPLWRKSFRYFAGWPLRAGIVVSGIYFLIFVLKQLSY